MLSLPLEYERVEPPSGADPDHRPYEGQATAVCDGPKLPGKVSNLHCGGQGPVACRLADPALRALGKTGCECRPSGPARAAGAGRTGSNLSGFLPNANFVWGTACGRRDSNAHAARFELARYPRFPSLPHRAPPGTRTPNHQLKRLLLWPLS